MGRQKKGRQRLRGRARVGAGTQVWERLGLMYIMCEAMLPLEGLQKDIKGKCLFDRWELISHWSCPVKLL